MVEYGQVRAFNVGVAQDTSIEAALIYDDFAYAQSNFGKGKWFYRSYEMLLKRFPMLSESTIRRHIKKLADAGYIRTKIMKVDGTPVCHFQIDRIVSVKLTESKETVKLTESINITTKETTIKADALLSTLISLVNPKEKATADRRRALAARMKEYTAEEITDSAKAFSQSVWHKQNKQMSIDNLLAPSKFGRWYAARGQKPADFDGDDDGEEMSIEERERRTLERMS